MHYHQCKLRWNDFLLFFPERWRRQRRRISFSRVFSQPAIPNFFRNSACTFSPSTTFPARLSRSPRRFLKKTSIYARNCGNLTGPTPYKSFRAPRSPVVVFAILPTEISLHSNFSQPLMRRTICIGLSKNSIGIFFFREFLAAEDFLDGPFFPCEDYNPRENFMHCFYYV